MSKKTAQKLEKEVAQPHLQFNQTRIESGLVKFGEDWRGVFLRGDDAFSHGMRLSTIVEEYLNGRKRETLSFNERMNLNVLESLRDQFLAVDESKPVPAGMVVQEYRGFDEIVK
jgi:hypothetical protein